MPQAASPLKIEDFSGGINENHIGAPLNEYQKADNLLITEDARLTQRDGSVILDTAAPKPDNARTGNIFEFQGELYTIVENKIFRKTSGAWTELTGPDGNPGLGVGDRNTSSSISFWNDHAFLTGDAGGKVAKIYKDETNTVQIRTAGMPEIKNEDNFVLSSKLTDMINRATLIRAALNTHFVNITTAHTAGDFVSAAQLPNTSPTTEATLKVYVGALLRAYDNHYQDFAQDKRTFHTTPNSEPVGLVSQQVLSTTDPATLKEAQNSLNDLYLKVNTHSGDEDIHNSNKTDLIDTSNDLISGVNSGPLPNKSVQHIYDLANELKARMNEHFADTTIHNSAETDTITLNDATTPETLMDLVEQLRLNYTRHLEDGSVHDAADTINKLTADASLKGTPSFTPDEHNGLGLGAFEETLLALVELRTQYNAHDTETGTNHTAEGPEYQVTNNVSTSATYTYVFLYSYTYKVGPREYTDRGPTLEKTVANTTPIGNYSTSITKLPQLLNGFQDNYDEDTVKIEIYRTVSGGDTFYKVGEVVNGTTTFTDQVPDTDITTKQLLYTTGGVLDNDPPPVSRCMHILNDIALYGDIIDTDGTRIKNRVRQSVNNDPDGCPATLFDDLEDNVVGISSAKNKFIVFCEQSIYRTEGSFDELGRGFMRHEKIGDVGLVSLNSIARTEFGVFFAGTNGFYFTDGFQLFDLTRRKLNKTYQRLIRKPAQQKRIYGAYDELGGRIWWAVQQDSQGVDNDSAFILETKVGFKNGGSFTTASNGLHFKPSALYFREEEMIRGDNRGYIFSHTDNLKSDPKVDTTAAVTAWTTKAVIPDFRSPASDFGSIQQRKWGTRINFVGRDTSNMAVQIKNTNDDKSTTSLKFIRYTGGVKWGDPSLLWGASTPVWGASRGFVDEWRRNVAGSLRFNFKQIQVTKATVVVDSSTDKGTCGVNSTTKVATLDTARRNFPRNPEDYVIAFENDSYVQEFTITDFTEATDGGDTFITAVTFSDADDDISSNLTTQGWVIRGQPKEEKINIHALNIQWSPLTPGKSQSDFGGSSESGEL